MGAALTCVFCRVLGGTSERHGGSCPFFAYISNYYCNNKGINRTYTGGTMKTFVIIILITLGWIDQVKAQRFFRITSNTGSVITALSHRPMVMTWNHAATGCSAMVEMNENLLSTNWVSYIHTRRMVTNNIETSNIDHPSQVPKTGQKNAQYQWDDGYYMKGVLWPNPRFSIQTNTNLVQDNMTGLMWARNANLAGQISWSNALVYCETLEQAEFTDWRLPNIRELLSLVDFSQVDPALPSGFPFTSVKGVYWGSTTYSHDESFAWTLEPSVGIPRAREKYGVLYVWPVRGPTDISKNVYPVPVPQTGQTNSYQYGDDGFYTTGMPWPQPRFTAGSGISSNCVRDNLTGLMWLRNPDHTPRTINDGIGYCEQLNGANGRGNNSDWRLPNVMEFVSLIDYWNGLPPNHPFIDAEWGSRLSSTRYESNHSMGWNVVIENGTLTIRTGALSDGYVWPVRDDHKN